jgi:GTP-binding protein
MIRKAVFHGSYYDVRNIPGDPRPQIAFAGRSNVGKSSLLNHLVGQKGLAKTSSTPGRTQSLNFFLIEDRYYFVDLPGYGYARAPQKLKDDWGKLVDKYVNEVENLCGMVFLLDCRRELNEMDLMLVDWLQNRRLDFLPVLTKADKLSRSALIRKTNETTQLLKLPAIPFSIVSGIGVKEVWKWILQKLGDR